MELGLSLGDNSSKAFAGFMEKPSNELGLGFNTTLSIGPIITTQRDQQHQEQEQDQQEQEDEAKTRQANNNNNNNNNHHHHDHGLHQFDLLPQLSLPWPPSYQNGSLSGGLGGSSRGLDVNVLPVAAAATEDEAEEGAALSSSPNSAASSFQMDLCIFRGGSGGGGGGSFSGSGGNYYGYNHGGGGGGKRDSDEDDNGGDGDGGDGGTRKKLRLSKEQSAYLEETFKEHNTLNPKQKQALARQLNLRPRQVEVWFQNRRARTKLKQTEVDCEYLKRCCETLTEENRRLHKELQELRALKANPNPFHMQLPATTLTMCPSCERVAPNPASSAAINNATNKAGASATAKGSSIIINESNSKGIGFPLGKPRFHHSTVSSIQD